MNTPSTPTVLVTGGSSGIGFELARLFAKDGARLVLVARGRDELERAAKDLRGEMSSSSRIPSSGIPTSRIQSNRQQHGSRIKSGMTAQDAVITIVADLSDPIAPQKIVDELTTRNLTVDVLVNNAGFGLLGAFSQTEWHKEAAMVQVNIAALTHLTKVLLPSMLKRKHGRILNVASTAAFQPGPFMAVYYATKAYVLSFSEALHEELRGTGVTVTTLCPGPTRTGFQNRAQIQDIRLFSASIMNAPTVARIAYQAMNRGQRLVIPGWRNALGAWLTRLAPRSLALRFVRSLQE